VFLRLDDVELRAGASGDLAPEMKVTSGARLLFVRRHRNRTFFAKFEIAGDILLMLDDQQLRSEGESAAVSDLWRMDCY